METETMEQSTANWNDIITEEDRYVASILIEFHEQNDTNRCSPSGFRQLLSNESWGFKRKRSVKKNPTLCRSLSIVPSPSPVSAVEEEQPYCKVAQATSPATPLSFSFSDLDERPHQKSSFNYAMEPSSHKQTVKQSFITDSPILFRRWPLTNYQAVQQLNTTPQPQPMPPPTSPLLPDLNIALDSVSTVSMVDYLAEEQQLYVEPAPSVAAVGYLAKEQQLHVDSAAQARWRRLQICRANRRLPRRLRL